MTSGAFKSAILAASVGKRASRVAVYYRAKIDDEVIYFYSSTPTYAGPHLSDSLAIVSQEWQILRGQEGTDAADHAAGAEIVMLA